MIYTLIYAERVVKKDIPKLGPNKERVKAAIESKLRTRPDLFGRPLQGELKGYRKFRVGNYRVLFLIKSSTVQIFLIEKRGSVYKEAIRRFVKRGQESN